MQNLRDHPTVRRFYSKGVSNKGLLAVPKLSAETLRGICLDLGADDVGFVQIDRNEIADQRDAILRVFPRARTLVSLACRISRENLRSPARSIASLELRQVGQKMATIGSQVAAAMERMGVRAVTHAVGFPMEMDQWPGRMHIVSHKPVAVAAGLGMMGLHRNVIHPVFGSFTLLDTILLDAELDAYSRPLDYNPCLNCKLCASACPTGAIEPDGYYNPVNCLTHTYRELVGGFTDWIENIADSKDSLDYRRRISDAETVSMWQSLANGPCYKSVYCMAVCPAGDDVIAPFLADRGKYVEEVVKPLQQREETVYVLPGSDAESHVLRVFPHKKIKRVGNGIRPPSIEAFLMSLPLAFQRHKSEGLEATYHFSFTGENPEAATVVIRDKRIEVKRGHEGTADLRIAADSRAWLRMLHKESNLLKEIALRRIRVKGPMKLFKAFGRCFASK